MRFISESDLGNINLRKYESFEKSGHILPSNSTAFLSFSHKDKDIALKIKQYLLSSNVKLYIDLLDADLNMTTDVNTAIRIKERIKSMKYFFLLATSNSTTSRWIPWELGIADGNKKYDQIFIIPFTENSGKSYGAEYMQIYQSIVMDDLRRITTRDPNSRIEILLEDKIR